MHRELTAIEKQALAVRKAVDRELRKRKQPKVGKGHDGDWWIRFEVENQSFYGSNQRRRSYVTISGTRRHEGPIMFRESKGEINITRVADAIIERREREQAEARSAAEARARRAKCEALLPRLNIRIHRHKLDDAVTAAEEHRQLVLTIRVEPERIKWLLEVLDAIAKTKIPSEQK